MTELDLERLVRREIANLNIYQEPTLEPDTIRLHANENNHPFPRQVLAEILARVEETGFSGYPDAGAHQLKKAIAGYGRVEPNQVLVGNGSNELIQAIMLTFGRSGSKVILNPPTFSMYRVIAGIAGAGVREAALTDKYEVDMKGLLKAVGEEAAPLVILCSPNNPTGGCLSCSQVEEILKLNDGLVVVDEAYFEFSGQTTVELLKKWPNLLVLRTFSKAFGLAGLRVGYMLADPRVVEQVSKVLLPYHLDSFSQIAAVIALRNVQFFKPLLEEIIAERERLTRELSNIRGLTLYPSQANFILFKVEGAKEIFNQLVNEGIYIRYFNDAPGLENCLRVSVGKKEENSKFVEKIKRLMGR